MSNGMGLVTGVFYITNLMKEGWEMISLKIKTTIEIDDCAAEVLGHFLSYEHIKHFNEKCSTRWTEEQMKEATKDLKAAVDLVLRSRRVAIEAINSEFKKGNSK